METQAAVSDRRIVDETALVEALRQGDRDAFATLVDANSPWMMRIALSYVSSRASAEDVVQEAWLRCLKGLDGFEGRSALKSWLFGQRAVFLLRDVEGWSSEDVCNALGISGSNQRVLLHRARNAIRTVLEDYLEGGELQ